MINVLFLAYEFPPLNEGGSNRPLHFVNHLLENDVVPTVITQEVTNDDNVDYTLLEKLDKNIEVIRVKKKNSIFMEKLLEKNYINILDSESKKWKEELFSRLEKLMITKDIQAIYVTAPPFSIVDLGVDISKKYNIPLVVDMRDHWSHWNITPFTS